MADEVVNELRRVGELGPVLDFWTESADLTLTTVLTTRALPNLTVTIPPGLEVAQAFGLWQSTNFRDTSGVTNNRNQSSTCALRMRKAATGSFQDAVKFFLDNDFRTPTSGIIAGHSAAIQGDVDFGPSGLAVIDRSVILMNGEMNDTQVASNSLVIGGIRWGIRVHTRIL